MFFEIPQKTDPTASWPKTNHGIAAKLHDGSLITVPIPADVVNTLIVGVSGYGKTTFTKAFVREKYKENQNLFSVFFQVKPDDFTGEFLRPEDKVITYSDKLFPKNTFRWNLIKEIRVHAKDEWETVLEEIASILFADLLEDKRNLIWADAGKNTFKAFILTLLHCYKNNPSNGKIISAMKNTPRKDFLKFLSKYPPNRSLLLDIFDYDFMHGDDYKLTRKASDTFFFLNNVLERFGGTFASIGGEDTLYDYLHGHYYGKRLFIVHDHKTKDSAKYFEKFIFKYIGNEILSQSSDFQGRQMLWVLDEIDKIEADIHLTQVVTLGRQFGLQTIVSTQSLESLFAIAPEFQGDHLTKASFAGFGMTVAFHPADPFTTQTLQGLYGKRIKQTVTLPLSRYDTPKIDTQWQPIVDDQDFANLGIGECFIKLYASDPVRCKILL